MFPAQTSLIPAVIALARFAENEGLGAILANYPYWYLGSTPFRFLTGPIVPLFLTLTHRFFPNFPPFEVFFFLLILGFLLGGAGVYLLVKQLNGEKTAALFAAFFYLFGPIMPFLFPFSDGVYLLAFSTLPFILFLYLKFLQKPDGKLKISLVILIAFALLVDTLIIPSLFLGMMAIFLAQVGWRKVEEKLKESLWLLAYSLLLATLWYTPGYWWTLLTTPSFGGKGLGQVIVWVGKLLPVALALTLAVFSVRFFKKRELLRDFCFFWLFIFGFLTLIRFFSDPDFWLDWTAYGIELQFGLGIALVLMTRRLLSKLYPKPYTLYPLLIFYILIFAFLANKYVLGTLQKDITQTVEYRVGRWLSESVKPGERVFLSGTTAFWLNAFFDVGQVRGGRDQASVDGRWREIAWEIREGTDSEKSIKWLKEFGVNYLVVHAQGSEEYYHDFKNPEKFENTGDFKKVFSEDGDDIYRVD